MPLMIQIVDYHKLRTIKNKKKLLLLEDFPGSGIRL